MFSPSFFRQLAKLGTELFGDREINGWVEATSSSRGLTGFFLNGNTALTDLDGAGAVEASAGVWPRYEI